MKLIQRIGYYLGGFSIGLIILAFFLNGKKTSCSYGPEARVLKNINTKKTAFSHKVKETIKKENLDSVQIHNVLKSGAIDFSKSSPRQEPCGVYLVEGSINDTEVSIYVENCDSIATITNLKLN
ncbi:hypothetical protein VOI54_13585 [Tamlana sp. 2201CG12-4]|uniref:hypothetical protein n=1 Tax=Tamlana sp. 2201CG12-4 TaxID=3112582 RepID=UPI002DC00432|nr:hypothetical protein [Tamlana sp. 2201CG12-4]MEC3908058.1 hypothetical protein [Tamlana sp. 2201CG12-4]